MKSSSLILIAAVGAILTSGASTAAPLYLKYEGIMGNVTHAGQGGWIEIQSVDWATPPPTPPPAPAPAGVATRGPGKIVVVKKVDKASPLLSKAAAAGKLLPAVQIELPKPSSQGPNAYYRYELKNVMVSSYIVSGQGAGDPLPTESISFNYASIELKYEEQKAPPKNPKLGAANTTSGGTGVTNPAPATGGGQAGTASRNPRN